MLEKNGAVTLIDSDFDDFYEGRVSDRVKQAWGLSLDELNAIIKSKNYTSGKPEYAREKNSNEPRKP